VHRITGPTGVLDNPLIQRLVALDLERSDFVIFGSGPLLACGLRKSIRDLDVVARGAAWQRVSTIGLSAVGVLTGDPTIQFWGGRIQCSQQWIRPGWDSDKLIDKADMIDGLRFARLADVLAYKQVLLRRKDIDDIRAITSYAPTTYQLDLMNDVIRAPGSSSPSNASCRARRQAHPHQLPPPPDETQHPLTALAGRDGL